MQTQHIILSRQDHFAQLFKNEPLYRLKQIYQILFNPRITSWDDATIFSEPMHAILKQHMPWLLSNAVRIFESKHRDTYKAILETPDRKRFETVLMANARNAWTICVSSQIGCAMGCTFCATGTMGLMRNLTGDEIIDQYRFWKYFLQNNLRVPQRISNVVFMGMGEPLANYEAIKKTIHTWLEFTDLGPTHITISTVGLLTQLERLLTDPDWPKVRIALSLHSAHAEKRKEIVPSSVPDFLPRLAAWSHNYQKKFNARRQYLTFEYTLLNTVNDTPDIAHELARYTKTTAIKKINVIPYNPVKGKSFERSQQERIDTFKNIIRSYGINITQRRTMGDDIAAACGQLVYQNA